MMRAWIFAGVLVCVLGIVGCTGKSAEGKVKIDSTEPFKQMKSTKSPPPQKPEK
jgi:hypothetical protein